MHHSAFCIRGLGPQAPIFTQDPIQGLWGISFETVIKNPYGKPMQTVHIVNVLGEAIIKAKKIFEQVKPHMLNYYRLTKHLLQELTLQWAINMYGIFSNFLKYSYKLIFMQIFHRIHPARHSEANLYYIQQSGFHCLSSRIAGLGSANCWLHRLSFLYQALLEIIPAPDTLYIWDNRGVHCRDRRVLMYEPFCFISVFGR